MKRTGLLIVVLALCCMSAARELPAPPGDPSPAYKVPTTFFGMNVHVWVTQSQPWPAIPFGSFRLWDSATGWAQINTSKGAYDWSQLDRWLDALKAHNINDALYTFGRVPRFATSKPGDQSCAYGPGQCDPPSDVNPDGTGTDQYWKDFVTAIANHAKESRTVRIKYWEVWNEPYLGVFWTGTLPQLVRMAKDAQTIIHGIDPDAIVLSPSAPLHFPKFGDFLANYLDAGGGNYADAIAFHGYVHPSASAFPTYLADIRATLAQHKLDAKPIWDTEASWGNGNNFLPDEDMQAAFVAQLYLLHWSQGIERLYWYAYNDGAVGKLWIADPVRPSQPGRITKAGIAYQELYGWLVGATLSRPCTQEDSVWTCNLTKADGQAALIVWSPDSERQYTPKASFKKFRDLEGKANAISGPFKIGPKPVLLESQP